ncbi:hypothetical protein KMW28_18800 [Flammeovirga yaeyamensis]|uniref:Uncharacterized protein n=1 Tax=Flammeovirga yaeyamensis TaxID=367791 RepID=A0AAX1N614_9BACT|nr:hypothetical protein [Flammeovirga yaeyamensis]MBB3701204.1 hypothetical protein [Flammeovirga yaeyamensis]NMF38470.1 hypothetical protein [Flammeovirga yaeyamensis]QWG01670.1 hypothetical protein KMW28_18800 [Flammeovirga yaeyamensis]
MNNLIIFGSVSFVMIVGISSYYIYNTIKQKNNNNRKSNFKKDVQNISVESITNKLNTYLEEVKLDSKKYFVSNKLVIAFNNQELDINYTNTIESKTVYDFGFTEDEINQALTFLHQKANKVANKNINKLKALSFLIDYNKVIGKKEGLQESNDTYNLASMNQEVFEQIENNLEKSINRLVG